MCRHYHCRHARPRCPAAVRDGPRALREPRGTPRVTPADVAAAAGCPLDDLYRHFPRKERFVLKLYERLAADLEGRVPELPAGTVAERFRYARSGEAGPARAALGAVPVLLPRGLDPDDRLAVLGRTSDRIRARVQGVFAAAVYGASDAPPLEQVPAPRAVSLRARTSCASSLALPGPDARPPALGRRGRVRRRPRRPRRAVVRHGQPGPVGRLMAPFARAAGPRRDRRRAPTGSRRRSCSRRTTRPTSRLAENILRDLFRHRRLQPGAGRCATDPCPQCLALHLPRVRRCLAAGEPIQLVLPAFPAKSANPQKVTRPAARPRRGTRPALPARSAATRSASRYPPGATLTICSDGRVFNDLVGVGDEAVTAYRARLIGDDPRPAA